MYHTEEISTHREVASEAEMEEPDDLQQLDDRKQEDIISTKNELTCSEIDQAEKTEEYEIPFQETSIQQDKLSKTNTDLHTEQRSQETRKGRNIGKSGYDKVSN